MFKAKTYFGEYGAKFYVVKVASGWWCKKIVRVKSIKVAEEVVAYLNSVEKEDR